MASSNCHKGLLCENLIKLSYELDAHMKAYHADILTPSADAKAEKPAVDAETKTQPADTGKQMGNGNKPTGKPADKPATKQPNKPTDKPVTKQHNQSQENKTWNRRGHPDYNKIGYNKKPANASGDANSANTPTTPPPAYPWGMFPTTPSPQQGYFSTNPSPTPSMVPPPGFGYPLPTPYRVDIGRGCHHREPPTPVVAAFLQSQGVTNQILSCARVLPEGSHSRFCDLHKYTDIKTRKPRSTDNASDTVNN